MTVLASVGVREREVCVAMVLVSLGCADPIAIRSNRRPSDLNDEGDGGSSSIGSDERDLEIQIGMEIVSEVAGDDR